MMDSHPSKRMIMQSASRNPGEPPMTTTVPPRVRDSDAAPGEASSVAGDTA